MPRYSPARELPEEVLTGLYIDGVWQSSSTTDRHTLIDPATERPVIEVPVAGPADVDAAVNAARAAFDQGPWPRMSPAERGAMVQRLGEAIGARLGDFQRAWTGLVGGPVMLGALLPVAPAIFGYYASLAQAFDFTDSRKAFVGHVVVSREPVGVAALITPWNSPLVILAYKLAPALVAGCCVVIKPSPETPVEALLIAKLADDIGFPPGVINVVTGGREVGEQLVAHRGVDKVSFTGSTQAGIAIAGVCARRMTRTSLELGGKSAAIVLDDAPLDVVLGALAPWSMPFSGQACLAQTRILAPRSRVDEIASAYSAAIASMPVGDPWDPGTFFGPVVSARQMTGILTAIEGARRQGAATLIGGGRHPDFENGFFVQPTVLAGVTREMSIAREETFGPVVSIMSYEDEEEAISLANDTDYGLHGSVFSADIDRAVRVAGRIRTGSIGVNTFNHDPVAPFGGFKLSGVGREGGPEGLLAFLEYKSTYFPADAG